MLAVLGALIANGLITVLKFIAAIFIFGVGASYALYEGFQKLWHPPEQLAWAYWVLGISFVLESGSIGLALYQEVKEAHHEGLTFGQYLRESKDPTAKTVIFEDSAALLGMIIAGVGIYLTDHQVGPSLFEGQPPGAFWDGLASMTIGVVLAIVAFSLARSSRGLLLGEAAIPKSVERIRQAILSHEHVREVVELLTMHLAPKQILINAHINFRNELGTGDIERVVHEVEDLIKRAEPKVDMIFLETARASQAGAKSEPIPQHIG